MSWASEAGLRLALGWGSQKPRLGPSESPWELVENPWSWACSPPDTALMGLRQGLEICILNKLPRKHQVNVEESLGNRIKVALDLGDHLI